jgi:hypothetical protein
VSRSEPGGDPDQLRAHAPLLLDPEPVDHGVDRSATERAQQVHDRVHASVLER